MSITVSNTNTNSKTESNNHCEYQCDTDHGPWVSDGPISWTITRTITMINEIRPKLWTGYWSVLVLDLVVTNITLCFCICRKYILQRIPTYLVIRLSITITNSISITITISY